MGVHGISIVKYIDFDFCFIQQVSQQVILLSFLNLMLCKADLKTICKQFAQLPCAMKFKLPFIAKLRI